MGREEREMVTQRTEKLHPIQRPAGAGPACPPTWTGKTCLHSSHIKSRSYSSIFTMPTRMTVPEKTAMSTPRTDGTHGARRAARRQPSHLQTRRASQCCRPGGRGARCRAPARAAQGAGAGGALTSVQKRQAAVKRNVTNQTTCRCFPFPLGAPCRRAGDASL